VFFQIWVGNLCAAYMTLQVIADLFLHSSDDVILMLRIVAASQTLERFCLQKMHAGTLRVQG